MNVLNRYRGAKKNVPANTLKGHPASKTIPYKHDIPNIKEIYDSTMAENV